MGSRDLRTTTWLVQDLNQTSVTIISDKAVWSSDVKVEGMSQNSTELSSDYHMCKVTYTHHTHNNNAFEMCKNLSDLLDKLWTTKL